MVGGFDLKCIDLVRCVRAIAIVMCPGGVMDDKPTLCSDECAGLDVADRYVTQATLHCTGAALIEPWPNTLEQATMRLSHSSPVQALEAIFIIVFIGFQ